MQPYQAFHLKLERSDLSGAKLALIPGDPDRVERIAGMLDKPKKLADNREFTSWLGWLQNIPVIITSTGIGGPSTSICVEELARLGVRSFLRVGTTGSIQPHIASGDIIVMEAAVRLDGASYHFAPAEFPAVADFKITRALADAAAELSLPYHVGIAASSDTFYPGQERYETYTGNILARFQGSLEQWQRFGVLNFEMETATLFTMCRTMGIAAGAVAGVIAQRTAKEFPDEATMSQTEENTIRVALQAAKKLVI